MNTGTRRAMASVIPRLVLLGLLSILAAGCTDTFADETVHRIDAERDLRSFDDWATASVLNMHVGWNAPRVLGQLSYRAWVDGLSHTPVNIVEQPFVIKGHLLAYWDIDYYDLSWETKLIDAQPAKTLLLRFYPQGPQDPKTEAMLEDLVLLAEDSRRAVRFFIYDSFNEQGPLRVHSGVEAWDQDEIEAVLEPFGALADSFKTDQEGYIAMPAKVTLTEVLTYHELSSTFLNGKLTDVQSWPEGAAFDSDIYDLQRHNFLSLPWQQFFRLDSSASMYTQPDKESKVVLLVNTQVSDSGPRVEKISTYSADWFLVRLYSDPDIKGYVRVNDLWIIN
ncbi:hypothetical protein [Nitrincola sp.]|uniref:hypothetical protein n=1 Tax=Nitrincola sp. TaxID=1926584 RepID=UPI003A9497B6